MRQYCYEIEIWDFNVKGKTFWFELGSRWRLYYLRCVKRHLISVAILAQAKASLPYLQNLLVALVSREPPLP